MLYANSMKTHHTSKPLAIYKISRTASIYNFLIEIATWGATFIFSHTA